MVGYSLKADVHPLFRGSGGDVECWGEGPKAPQSGKVGTGVPAGVEAGGAEGIGGQGARNGTWAPS